jgi:hypothetical protein
MVSRKLNDLPADRLFGDHLMAALRPTASSKTTRTQLRTDIFVKTRHDRRSVPALTMQTNGPNEGGFARGCIRRINRRMNDRLTLRQTVVHSTTSGICIC